MNSAQPVCLTLFPVAALIKQMLLVKAFFKERARFRPLPIIKQMLLVKGGENQNL